RLASLGLGYVPQGRGIFPLLSVEENLCLGLTRRPSKELLDELFHRFPRLKERRAQAAGTLSGGEQQMLALARCLIMQPTLIMLDEPTEGIMPKLVAQIRNEIVEIARRGIAVLIVEQNVRTAMKLANRVYLMERGQVVAEATPDKLKSSPDLVHRYLGVSLESPKGQQHGKEAHRYLLAVRYTPQLPRDGAGRGSAGWNSLSQPRPRHVCL